MPNDESKHTPLNCDRNAERWAKEFNEVIAKMGAQPFDHSFLIGWFANAMMCGEDTCRWKHERTKVDLLGARTVAYPEYVYSKRTGRKWSKWFWDSSLLRGEERAKFRSRFFPKIAAAMADQWGNL